MSLGYALLHPGRIEVALEAEPQRRGFDAAADIVLGALGAGDLGAAAEAYLRRRSSDIESIGDRLERLVAAGGPLAGLRGFFEAVPETPQAVGEIGGRLAAFLGELDPDRLRVQANRLLDDVFRVVPLKGPALSAALVAHWEDGSGVLGQLLRSGRRDKGAHRAFRAAHQLRRLLRPVLSDTERAVSGVDLEAVIRAGLDDMLARLDLGTLGGFKEMLAGLQTDFGPLLQALANVSVEVTVEGPSGQPETPPTWQDDDSPVPHTQPAQALWVVDLVTGILVFFCLLWEMIRTANWRGRPMDGVLSLLGLLWHTTRTVLRAAIPSALNESGSFGRWFFSDAGDFVLHLLLRLLAAFHEVKASSNYFLSVGRRVLMYLANVVNVRMIYLFARSWWYWRDRAKRGGRENDTLSLARIIWGVWPIMWFLGFAFGIFQPWEQYRLEDTPTTMIVSLILVIVLGWGLGWLVLFLLSGDKPWKLAGAPDWATLIMIMAAAVLGMLLIIMIMTSVETGDASLVWILLAVVAVLLLPGFIGLPIVWSQESLGVGALRAMTQLVVLPNGVLGVGVMFFVLWWSIIDDGRDKHGFFAGMDPERSPYKLPYPKDANWLCGQGVHGIFSHTAVSASNHLAYDFNEYENEPTLAARGGIVVQLTELNPNSSTNQNDAVVQHLAWAEGHDPGEADEGVLTYSQYIHLSQDRVWADLGHRIVQGYHLSDIDDTGRSAQHHLHIAVVEGQGGGRPNRSIPHVYSDASLRGFRNFPLLAWLPGKGHIPGKPLGFAFYTSDNDERDPLVNPVVVTTSREAAGAGATVHEHALHIDRGVVSDGPLPDSLRLRTTIVAGHDHEVVLSRAALRQMLRLEDFGSLRTETADGHDHALLPHSHGRGMASAQTARVRVVAPPAGRVLALEPGPYRLLGEQLVLRVNDRTTEYFFYGAIRGALAGDIALDRGIPSGQGVAVNGTSHALPAGAANGTARASARLLSRMLLPSLRGARPLPVVIVESRRRGSASSVEVLEAPDRLFATVPPGRAAGSGVFPDGDAVEPPALAAHIDAILRNGWPAPPPGISATLGPDGLTLAVGGAPADFGHGSGRLRDVLGGLYDPATRLLRGTGPMPLATGQVSLTAGYAVPILALPARVEIDLDHPAFAGAMRAETALEVEVLGSVQRVRFRAEDASAEDVARRITAAAEGVRAHASGLRTVAVETVAAGGAATLVARKPLTGGGAFTASGSGRSPAGDPADAAAILPAQLRDLILAAGARASLPYDPAAVQPAATVPGGRIVLSVAEGETIAVAEARLLGEDLGFEPVTAGEPHALQSRTLGATVALGSGWIDLEVSGQVVRVPLDAEPARLELGPLLRLPRAGERLRLRIDDEATIDVAFTGDERSTEDVVAAVSASSPRVQGRFGCRLSIENLLHGNTAAPRLAASPGLAAAGFLREAGTLQGTSLGLVADHWAVGPAALGTPARTFGRRLEAFTIAETAAAGATAWRIEAAAGREVIIEADPVGDVFAFAAPAGGGANVQQSQPLADGFDLGRSCQSLSIRVRQGTRTTAESRAQVSASPAVARAADAAVLPLPAPARIAVTIVTPTAGGSDARTATVDLDEITTLDEVAEAFVTAVPELAAFVVGPAGVASERLHLETRGGGSGWELRLDNPDALLRLGFRAPELDRAAGVLTAQGRGNVRDGAAVRHDELRAVFAQAVATTTEASDPTTGAPRPFEVLPVPAGLELRALEGAISVEADPPELAAALAVTAAGDTATLNIPGPTVALENGTIVVRTGGATVAAALIATERARIRADDMLPDPASPESQALLALLRAHSLRVTTETATALVPPLPGDPVFEAFEAVVEWIARHAPFAWIGLRPEPGSPGQRRVVLESRGRGSDSQVTFDFADFGPPPFPAAGILGFQASQLANPANVAGWRVSADGSGTFADLGAVPRVGAGSLAALLEEARDRGAARQGVYRAEAAGGAGGPVLRVRANAPQWLMNPVAAAGGVALAAPPGLPASELEAAYPAAREVEAGVTILRVNQGPGLTRDVHSLLAGAPGRLPPLAMPNTPAALGGKTLRLAVGAEVHSVPFEAPADAAHVAAQIERHTGWQVRARVEGARLDIETVGAGSAQRIELRPAPPDAVEAVTGDPATGFTAPEPLPIVRDGSGTVPDAASVSAEDYASALALGWVGLDRVRDTTRAAAVSIDRSSYRAGATAEEHAVLASNRSGCMSAVVPVVTTPALALETGLARAAAVRASVRLGPIVAPVPLQGTLTIELNANGVAARLPAPALVPVPFEPGDYDAPAVAARIHDALFRQGLGMAAAYPDGSVVVETATPGLAGTIRVPAPGTATSGADQALATALTGGASHFDRGWPGAGMARPGDAMPLGWRATHAAAQGAGEWSFADAAGRVARVSLTAGQDAAAIAEALDAALANAVAAGLPAARIGLASIGTDGLLYVDALAEPLTFALDGQPLAVLDPDRPGTTRARRDEPLLGLRRTEELRTFRYMRDRSGEGDPADADDAGWIRTPIDINGVPGTIGFWPRGRYFLAVRSDGAKATNYDASGGMVRAAVDGPEPGTAVILQARYWAALTNGELLRVLHVANGDVLLDMVRA
jgi:hypothetical protein